MSDEDGDPDRDQVPGSGLSPEAAARLERLVGQLADHRERIGVERAPHRVNRFLVFLVAGFAAVVVASFTRLDHQREPPGPSLSSSATQASFAAAVRRIVADPDSDSAAAAPAEDCGPATLPARTTRLAVTFDGSAALLAVRATEDGQRRAEVYACDSARPLRSTEVNAQ